MGKPATLLQHEETDGSKLWPTHSPLSAPSQSHHNMDREITENQVAVPAPPTTYPTGVFI